MILNSSPTITGIARVSKREKYATKLVALKQTVIPLLARFLPVQRDLRLRYANRRVHSPSGYLHIHSINASANHERSQHRELPNCLRPHRIVVHPGHMLILYTISGRINEERVGRFLRTGENQLLAAIIFELAEVIGRLEKFDTRRCLRVSAVLCWALGLSIGRCQACG